MGKVDLNAILEQIKTTMNSANTTTASPIDLSSGMVNRVNFVGKTHPLKIPVQPSLYPFVTCYVVGKSMDQAGICKTQLNAKKKGVVNIEIVGAVWNNNFSTQAEDPADLDCNNLMENIEYILRSSDTLSNNVTWQIGESVRYYDSINEEAHLRAGIMTLKATVFY